MYNGAHVDISNRKAGEMLARLALENGAPMAKFDVAELLWPGCGHEQAMGSLYKVCSYIKHMHIATGVAVPLVSTRGELRLDMALIECDARQFVQLCMTNHPMNWEKAVMLYRGPLLAGDYFEWTSPWEASFDMRYRDILKKLADCYKNLGNTIKSNYYRAKLDKSEGYF